MQNERLTEARVATFNFSADHGDRFYLQPAHGETEKDGGRARNDETATKRERASGLRVMEGFNQSF